MICTLPRCSWKKIPPDFLWKLRSNISRSKIHKVIFLTNSRKIEESYAFSPEFHTTPLAMSSLLSRVTWFGDSNSDGRFGAGSKILRKIKEKFVGKCFPIFSRAAVPRRQPDASEGAKNRLTVFTFTSDPRFRESTKIARERRTYDGSSTIVRGLANLKLIVYFENPAISIFLLKVRRKCPLSL